MANGVIKRLVSEKGFGFIRDDKGTEWFFHRSAVKNIPFDELKEGKKVSFSESSGAKGPRAEQIYVD